MAETIDSFLEHRYAELMAGDRTLPLDYNELRDLAIEHLPQGAYDYAAGGAGTEDTMHANRAAFQRYRIVTRVLQDVTERNLEAELFGHAAAAPLVLAPIGGQVKYHEDGELATARASGKLGVPTALSTTASYSIEEVATANGDGPRLFQLYWTKDWEIAASLVKRAEAAGYNGIVLTVDSQLSKWRQRNLRNAYSGPKDAPKGVFESDPVVQKRASEMDKSLKEYIHESPDLSKDASLTWDDLDTLREWTDLPIILKGILAPEDARQASEWGADGVIVSNHGGRQIDGSVATLDQLPAVVEAVDDDTTVILDSGVRSGADVFRVLALGADAVQFGRPYIFGLAIAGQHGVHEVVCNYLAELESIMGLSGHTSIEQISQDAINIRPYGDAHVTDGVG